jgi:Ca2+-binding RTX toxin-like protein
MPGPSLGINLSSLADWSTAFPFIDHFKMSRPWFTQEGGAWDSREAHLLNLDSEGWVRGFTQNGSPAPFERVASIWTARGNHLRDGNYVIDWKGEGSLDVGGATVVSRSGNRIVVDPTGDMSWITINSTDPNRTGNYIRDIRVYHESDKALLDAGEIFNPAFLEKVKDFRALRFMDWMDTNGSPVRSWAEAKPEGAASQAGGDMGASVEVMVALANKVDADPWFSIPHGADANYIRQFATYVRDHLDSGLKARFEYSNEVWNWGFQQAQWADQQGKAAWGAGTEGAWMQWYGVKAAEMARIVADVFGAETGTRALNVFSTQSAWHGLENYALNAPAHVARGGAAPKDAPFHVYAIAPYFGGGLGSDGVRTKVKTWASQGETGMKAALADLSQDINNLARTVAYHAAVAQREGWQLEGYEGGQHIVEYTGDPVLTRFFTALADRPEMQQLYTQYFNMWKANGGGMMTHYSDFGAGDQWGSWGIWDSAYSGNTSRANAVEAFRDNVDAWWADSRPESVFNGGGTVTQPPAQPQPQPLPQPPSLSGTAGADTLRGTANDDLISGLAGDDQILGEGGNDKLVGGDGNDRLDGGAGQDQLDAGNGNDRLDGGTGNDLLEGGSGDDWLEGREGSDALLGGAGADVLVGRSGEDRLVGGANRDLYYGGIDGVRDVFVFGALSDSAVGSGRDAVHDFVSGVDDIDLTGIDARTSTTGTNDAFAFAGRTAAAHSVWWTTTSEGVLLRADATGDGVADIEVMLRGVSSLSAGDVLL